MTKVRHYIIRLLLNSEEKELLSDACFDKISRLEDMRVTDKTADAYNTSKDINELRTLKRIFD